MTRADALNSRESSHFLVDLNICMQWISIRVWGSIWKLYRTCSVLRWFDLMKLDIFTVWNVKTTQIYCNSINIRNLSHQNTLNFKHAGSGYIFKRWDVLTVVITKYSPVSGSKYIPTPPLLKGRRCLLNIHNTDVNCFLYCIAAAIVRPKKNATRPGYYKPLLSRFKLLGAGIVIQLSFVIKSLRSWHYYQCKI